MSLAVLVVGQKGVVTHASPGATDLLGPAVGTTCCDVVRARDAQGAPLCIRTCSGALRNGGGRERDARPVRIRGQWARIVCTPLSGQHSVSIFPETPKSLEPVLTCREREVLTLVADGLTTRSIAKRLAIQPATVRTHVEHAREKLVARTRAEAVARALDLGELKAK